MFIFVSQLQIFRPTPITIQISITREILRRIIVLSTNLVIIDRLSFDDYRFIVALYVGVGIGILSDFFGHIWWHGVRSMVILIFGNDGILYAELLRLKPKRLMTVIHETHTSVYEFDIPCLTLTMVFFNQWKNACTVKPPNTEISRYRDKSPLFGVFHYWEFSIVRRKLILNQSSTSVLV